LASHYAEVAAGERFQFGENWKRFLESVDDSRIAESQRSLLAMLETDRLDGLDFVDVGSGSGLSSLAARRSGARVISFDYDPASVACTRELRRRFQDGDADWKVGEGSALDPTYLESLGTFDVVYSWGVLHHTGDMWNALGNVVRLVRPGGALFIAIYNDQGLYSRIWLRIKKTYCSSPRLVQWLLLLIIATYSTLKASVGRLLRGENPLPWLSWTRYKRGNRGMSWWRDLVDWVGGYPFEVATPEAILDFYRQRGFELHRLKTWGGKMGCNEFVFRRSR
jgi:2-polyprenyl-3-methyl-5-hydroxy-6-metoxy-1,4-benzoquinol methylase